MNKATQTLDFEQASKMLLAVVNSLVIAFKEMRIFSKNETILQTDRRTARRDDKM